MSVQQKSSEKVEEAPTIRPETPEQRAKRERRAKLSKEEQEAIKAQQPK